MNHASEHTLLIRNQFIWHPAWYKRVLLGRTVTLLVWRLNLSISIATRVNTHRLLSRYLPKHFLLIRRIESWDSICSTFQPFITQHHKLLAIIIRKILLLQISARYLRIWIQLIESFYDYSLIHLLISVLLLFLSLLEPSISTVLIVMVCHLLGCMIRAALLKRELDFRNAVHFFHHVWDCGFLQKRQFVQITKCVVGGRRLKRNARGLRIVRSASGLHHHRTPPKHLKVNAQIILPSILCLLLTRKPRTPLSLITGEHAPSLLTPLQIL